MKRETLIGVTLLAYGVLISLSGCGQKPAEAGAEKPAVTINKLQLSLEELQKELQETSWFEEVEDELAGENPEWLKRLIERELLVQEAQRLGLDRQPGFMRTIERFWKEALIKTLLIRKGQEISAQIHVYEPEIEAQYKQMAAERTDGTPLESLSELREEIRRELRAKKEMEAMDQWVHELQTKSHIVIDREAVSGMK
jgi:hypothetical protein